MKSHIIEYWKNKLYIDYNTELENYKRLCGISNISISKHVRKNDRKNDNYYLSYVTWKEHILKTIKDLSINELEEYSRFLNQQIRNNDIAFSQSQTILVPYIICLVSCVISFAFNIFAVSDTSDLNVMLFPICLVVLLWFIIHMFKKMYATRREAVYKYFYQDLKEIVDERLDQLNKNIKKQQYYMYEY